MGSNPIAQAALLVVAACAALALTLAFLRRPRWAMIAWTIALFFTPVWLGAQAGVYVTALTAVTVLAVAAALLGGGVRWSHMDSLAAGLFFLIVLAHLFGGSTWGHLQDVLTMWMLPYAWGRLVLARVSHNVVAACIAVAAIVAAALAIIEFVTVDNIFFLIPGSESSIWGTQQIRAGLPRAEGAFGHSIALGGTLAMSSAFLLTVRWPAWVRAVGLAVVMTGTAVTFSRIGLIGLALTVVLVLVFLGRAVGTRLRATVLILLGIGAVVGLPLLLEVFGEAGAEAEGSAEYRADLLPLLNEMVPLGVSPAREVLPTGQDYFGGFRSIDSALILIGLRFGWIPLAVLLLLLLIAILSILRGRGSPASVAVVAQIPAFATVALITQYSAAVWFVAGLAVASYTLEPGTADDRGQVAEDAAGVRRAMGGM